METKKHFPSLYVSVLSRSILPAIPYLAAGLFGAGRLISFFFPNVYHQMKDLALLSTSLINKGLFSLSSYLKKECPETAFKDQDLKSDSFILASARRLLKFKHGRCNIASIRKCSSNPSTVEISAWDLKNQVNQKRQKLSWRCHGHCYQPQWCVWASRSAEEGMDVAHHWGCPVLEGSK